MVTPAVPHPLGDTAAKWFYVLIKGLLERNHKVICLTASEEPERLVEDAKKRLSGGGGISNLEFRFFRMKAGTNVFRRKSRSMLRPFSETLYVDGLGDALQTNLRKGYDVLHLEQLWTGWLGFDVPKALLNIHHFEIIDCEDRTHKTFKEKKALLQMKRATYKIIKNTKNMRMFTHRLLERARSINPDANYWVIPFALDMCFYPLQPMIKEPVIGLFGSMHWEPSRSAAERLLTCIWPLIKKKVPEAKLLIAGWNAKKYLSKYMPTPDVTLEENLPHPIDFFSRVAVMVYAPLRGSGMKIKVMESMAYGVPVVTTWEGVEGIEYQNGVQCYVTEEDEKIAIFVGKLLDDLESRLFMRENARKLMEERYSSHPVVESILKVYEQIQY
jgi:glycosyltransferase involved in cell wall biosynthesis